MCKCKPGYEGNGEYCVFDRCSMPGQCGINAYCINTIGSFICVCREGFVKVNSTCLAKACVSGTAGCSPNANCITIQGSYLCECKPGFEGDGFKCVSTSPAGPAIRRYSDTSMLGRIYRSTNFEQIPLDKDLKPYPNPYPTADPNYPSTSASYSPYQSTSPSYSSYPSTSPSYPSKKSAKKAKSSKKKGKSSKSKNSSRSRSGLPMAQQPFMYAPSSMFKNIEKHLFL
ncbi:nephronectin-like [Pecten maximus]|uniref:nephronectin-like n=1 Tax=Pecten maximus TaxID=6579 RepID=UPI001458B9B8|nr:nephronectin-like [Pecten maximus]